ncbi:MAG: hypothetical protein HFH31_01290 [Bacilli bacterium]|nr:hypothetical protein [Bacilli bacterium]
MEDHRSKEFVFVPFCLFAQSYQAEGIVKYEWSSSIRPIIELLMDYNINMIQMPCSEASFHNSLIRKPKGILKYDTEEFNEHCTSLANHTLKEIEQLLQNGYKVKAILGIEQSPSCCVNYIYTNKGTEKRKGLYMEKLYDKVKEYQIPFIGINRKNIKKALHQLEEVLQEGNKHENIKV